MVGIVIVSHSAKAAEGIREMAMQMAKNGQNVIAAGGTASGEIGTDPLKISEAIQQADQGDGVAVLVDLGSAVFSTETAIELLEGVNVRVANAPILEGAIGSVVEASLGSSLDKVIATAEEARNLQKL